MAAGHLVLSSYYLMFSRDYHHNVSKFNCKTNLQAYKSKYKAAKLSLSLHYAQCVH